VDGVQSTALEPSVRTRRTDRRYSGRFELAPCQINAASQHLLVAMVCGIAKVRRGPGQLESAAPGHPYIPATMSKERPVQQADIALASFNAGVCASATLSIGQFDSPANNDPDQMRLIPEFLAGAAMPRITGTSGRRGRRARSQRAELLAGCIFFLSDHAVPLRKVSG
jgi:hypothetical protein